MLVFKALNNLAPVYISDMLQWKVSTRELRSASQPQLSVPKTRLKTVGDPAVKQHTDSFKSDYGHQQLRNSTKNLPIQEIL